MVVKVNYGTGQLIVVKARHHLLQAYSAQAWQSPYSIVQRGSAEAQIRMLRRFACLKVNLLLAARIWC